MTDTHGTYTTRTTRGTDRMTDERPRHFRNRHGQLITYRPAPAGRCHRWVNDHDQWCGASPIGEWQVGPLCAEHAPTPDLIARAVELGLAVPNQLERSQPFA